MSQHCTIERTGDPAMVILNFSVPSPDRSYWEDEKESLPIHRRDLHPRTIEHALRGFGWSKSRAVGAAIMAMRAYRGDDSVRPSNCRK